MIGDFGEGKVTIDKAELLAAIKANRKTHAELYQEAKEGYLAACVERLQEMLNLAKKGEVHLTVGLTAPENHTKDYDKTIKMLEMSISNQITISDTQFDNYVMDNWVWSRQFRTISESYMKKM